MKDYQNFSIDDFVVDDTFCQWVINPDEGSNLFWNTWIKDHPAQQQVIFEARIIVNQLNEVVKQPVSSTLLKDTWDRIETDIDAQPVKKKDTTSRRIYAYGWAAAVLAFFLTVSLWIYNIEYQSEWADLKDAPSSSEWIVYENSDEAVNRIELSDGSIITLEPKSIVKYPRVFGNKKRAVVLEGEAFFEVTRDTLRPFSVYANAALIRVLGTSFFVKAKDKDKEVEVIVKTGKVAVYKRKEVKAIQNLPTKKIQPIVVTPNQKVVFDKIRQTMTKRLTSTPTLIKPLRDLPLQIFEEVEVASIFNVLEEAYGVEITHETNEKLTCPLTTTLTEQTLFEKLDIICAPLGLNYYEKDARIVITGQCN